MRKYGECNKMGSVCMQKYVFYPRHNASKLPLQLSFLNSDYIAPSSPPNDYQGHNLSSTAVKVSWGNVPKPSRNGVLLGFHVLCERPNSTAKHFANIKSGSHSCEFKGLEKFTNYSCRLRAYNTFGNGTWSKKLVISTDEDGRLIKKPP